MAKAEYAITVSVRWWAVPLVWLLVRIPSRWMRGWWVRLMDSLMEVD